MDKEQLKEQLLEDFLESLQNLVFVKQTNSVTGDEELMENSIKDYEATIEIKGEWDREDLKDILFNLKSKIKWQP